MRYSSKYEISFFGINCFRRFGDRSYSFFGCYGIDREFLDFGWEGRVCLYGGSCCFSGFLNFGIGGRIGRNKGIDKYRYSFSFGLNVFVDIFVEEFCFVLFLLGKFFDFKNGSYS